MQAIVDALTPAGFDILFFFFLCCTVVALFVIFFQDTINWWYQTNKFARLIKFGFNPDTMPDWKAVKCVFRGTTEKKETVEISSIAYRSKLNATSYGIESVDASHTGKLGLVRRLRRYKRKQLIYVPEIAKNAVRCDGWISDKNSHKADNANDTA